MKALGKVGDSVTFFDTSTMKGNCLLSYSKKIKLFNKFNKLNSI